MSNEDLFKGLEDAFENISIVEVPLGDRVIAMTSMSEIPVAKMMEFMIADNNDKLIQMFGLVELCIVDPEDFKIVKQLNTKKFIRFIDDWTERSSDEAMGEPLD